MLDGVSNSIGHHRDCNRAVRESLQNYASQTSTNSAGRQVSRRHHPSRLHDRVAHKFMAGRKITCGKPKLDERNQNFNFHQGGGADRSRVQEHRGGSLGGHLVVIPAVT